MLSHKVIAHTHLTLSDLLAICEIKSRAWPYSIDEQKKWVSQNIKPDDLHFLSFKDGEFIAYLNLVKTELKIDNTIIPIYGIGNVCSRDTNKGYGGILLNHLNIYLTNNTKQGLLFCKDKLVDFYSKYGWLLIDKLKLNGNLRDKSDFNIMIFNINPYFKTIEYNDQLF